LVALDCGRRADAERKDEAGRLSGGIGRCYERGADYDRNWTDLGLADNSRMRRGANGTFVARELAVVRMDVDCLDEPHQRH
jgi:hypothetical protein